MKKLFIAAMMLLLCVNSSSAQKIVRSGKVFKSEKSIHKTDTLLTSYRWEADEKQYPIIVNKSTGRCYIWKKSGKTGRLYKMYMKPAVSQTVCKELDIEYKKKLVLTMEKRYQYWTFKEGKAQKAWTRWFTVKFKGERVQLKGYKGDTLLNEYRE